MKKLTPEQAVLLSRWYTENKRSFPWRDTGDPYDVWVSEIMLQQTRIEVVRRRFALFKEALPDVFAVSACEDDALMRLWEGMGYYSRARNLKKCAAVLVSEYGGQFPADAGLLKKLPGIGPYTAGAIASIAFDLPVAAVDGNVLRVLARLFEIRDDVRLDGTKKLAEEIMDNTYLDPSVSPALVNQGIMELGETVCLPNTLPDCMQCPLHASCMAYKNGTAGGLPYRSALKKRRTEKKTLLIIRDGERFLIRKRPDKGLLAGLYEFASIEGHTDEAGALNAVKQIGLVPLRIRHLPSSKHIFTHLEWDMAAYEISVENMETVPDGLIAVTKKELSSLAVPSAFRTYTEWYSLRG